MFRKVDGHVAQHRKAAGDVKLRLTQGKNLRERVHTHRWALGSLSLGVLRGQDDWTDHTDFQYRSSADRRPSTVGRRRSGRLFARPQGEIIMRIFVTGAPGFIGSALVPELIKAGHQVLGLTRSEAGAVKLRAGGAEPLHGNIEDLDSLRKGASDSDGVIHLAFNHDFSQFEKNAADERKAIAAIGEVLLGSSGPFVITSATAIAAN